MGLLGGKVAVVTGGGAGIGEAVARLFAEHECRVVVAGRRLEPLREVARAIDGLAVQADVADERQVAALMMACRQRFGRLDVLVNNAAVVGPTVSIEEEDAKTWDEVFAINVRGMMLCIKHAVPLMKAQGGAIVNVSSDGVWRPRRLRACYIASKFAVMGLTESVAQEVGRHKIRVNAILPGATDTQMLRDVHAARARASGRQPADVMAESLAKTALGDIATPRDIAEAVLYLSALSGRAVTGTSITINAGRD